MRRVHFGFDDKRTLGRFYTENGVDREKEGIMLLLDGMMQVGIPPHFDDNMTLEEALIAVNEAVTAKSLSTGEGPKHLLASGYSTGGNTIEYTMIQSLKAVNDSWNKYGAQVTVENAQNVGMSFIEDNQVPINPVSAEPNPIAPKDSVESKQEVPEPLEQVQGLEQPQASRLQLYKKEDLINKADNLTCIYIFTANKTISISFNKSKDIKLLKGKGFSMNTAFEFQQAGNQSLFIAIPTVFRSSVITNKDSWVNETTLQEGLLAVYMNAKNNTLPLVGVLNNQNMLCITGEETASKDKSKYEDMSPPDYLKTYLRVICNEKDIELSPEVQHLELLLRKAKLERNHDDFSEIKEQLVLLANDASHKLLEDIKVLTAIHYNFDEKPNKKTDSFKLVENLKPRSAPGLSIN